MNGASEPLSAFALDVLRRLQLQPMPRWDVDHDVARRLEREQLAETYAAASPYLRHPRASEIQWLRITESGRARLAPLDRRRGL